MSINIFTLPGFRPMQEDMPDIADFIASQKAKDFLAFVQSLDGDETARYVRLRESRPELDPQLAWFLAELPLLRVMAESKFPEAARLFFTREQLEQATARPIAAYRAKRFEDCNKALDLCAGLGGDTIAIARAARKTTAVEKNRMVFACLSANIRALALNATPVMADASDFVARGERFDAVMFDPSRRDLGKRSRAPMRTYPPFELWRNIVPKMSEKLTVKLSPMAGEFMAPSECDVEYISYRGECRELALHFGLTSESRRMATKIISSAGEFAQISQPRSADREKAPLSREIMDYVFEPDAAVIRSGLIGKLATMCGLSLIDPEIAYLTGNSPVQNPFLDCHRVIDVDKYNEKRLSRKLREAAIGSLTILKRGFPERPEQVMKRLKLRGRGKAVLILTRIGDRHYSILAAPEVEPNA